MFYFLLKQVQGSTTSLEDVKSVEKSASSSSLNVNDDYGVEKVDGRANKFSELSRSNASLETASNSASAAMKYASCFSISRRKAPNIASYNEFNKETEQVRNYHKKYFSRAVFQL